MSTRLLITADLHYNHGKSKPIADDLIEQMNRAGGDAVLVVGDTGIGDGDALEQCLSLFKGFGQKLVVAGNHELWTRGEGARTIPTPEPGGRDSLYLLEHELPARVRAVGWTWLEGHPTEVGGLTVVGSMGWYDYSFAQPGLCIPKRFYAAKVSPGAAARLSEFAALFDKVDPDDPEQARASDVNEHALQIVARWNDGRHVKLPQGFTDETLLDRLLHRLDSDLQSVAPSRPILAAVHHLPFRELLPPPHSAQWDFVKAYLGSEKIGQLLLRYPNVTRVFCGHSHLPAQVRMGSMDVVNIGSGYRWKTFHTLDV